jgi:hypothetical protein
MAEKPTAQKILSQQELAKRSCIAAAQISRIISCARGTGQDSLVSIARAPHIPREEVLRSAGLLSPVLPHDAHMDSLIYKLEQLSDEELDEYERYLDF